MGDGDHLTVASSPFPFRCGFSLKGVVGISIVVEDVMFKLKQKGKEQLSLQSFAFTEAEPASALPFLYLTGILTIH